MTTYVLTYIDLPDTPFRDVEIRAVDKESARMQADAYLRDVYGNIEFEFFEITIKV